MSVLISLCGASLIIATGLGAAVASEGGVEPEGLYCKLTTPELRQRVGEIKAEFVTAIVAVDELEDGYRYWFSKSPGRLSKLGEFVEAESECCPFLHFQLEVVGEAKEVSLALRGPAGTKEFLKGFALETEFDLEAALAAGRARGIEDGQ